MAEVLDILIRFVMLPTFGMWAFVRLVKELRDAVREVRSGGDVVGKVLPDGKRW